MSQYPSRIEILAEIQKQMIPSFVNEKQIIATIYAREINEILVALPNFVKHYTMSISTIVPDGLACILCEPDSGDKNGCNVTILIVCVTNEFLYGTRNHLEPVD